MDSAFFHSRTSLFLEQIIQDKTKKIWSTHKLYYTFYYSNIAYFLWRHTFMARTWVNRVLVTKS